SSTIYFQTKKGLTHFAIVRPMLLPIVVGVMFSVLIAHAIPTGALRYGFAIYLLLFFFVSFLFTPANKPDADLTLPNVEVRGVGFGVGLLSGLLGIGGAFLTVPYLVGRGFSFRQAVGASPAVQFSVSVTGGIGYLFSGVGKFAGAPVEGLVGSVHIPILIFLGLAAMTASKYGVKLAQWMSARSLKLGFEIFLLVIALKLFFA
ncbi:MAG: TSUP family transporter, partial [Burkholderiales bacterium]